MGAIAFLATFNKKVLKNEKEVAQLELDFGTALDILKSKEDFNSQQAY